MTGRTAAGRAARLFRLGAVALALVPVPGASAGPASAGMAPGDEAEVLPRSIYVPVRFEVASCLRDVVIRGADGAVRGVAPGRLVSQFTFYQARPGANPAWERLTVEGRVEGARREDGEAERFRAAIVITPASIYVGNKRLDLDLETRMERFRWKTDLRYPERTLRLRPAGKCDSSVTTTGPRPPPPAGS